MEGPWKEFTVFEVISGGGYASSGKSHWTAHTTRYLFTSI